jgi:phosphate transport system substrate-binding protein
VVQGVASDKYAIGYSGIGYKTADVRAVPLAKTAKSKPIAAVPEVAYTGEYPLARFLLIYVNYKPNSQLDPLRREFLKYVFSKQGQQDVIKDGYIPVTARIATQALTAIGLEETSASGEAKSN